MTELADEIYGHYRLERAIGAGALGTVYRATDQREARTVAVRLLSAARCADDEFMARLREHAPRWAAVEGAQLVPLSDWGEAAGRAYLVSPLLEAGTLRQRFDAADAWRERPLHAILALLAGAASGVATLHRAGIVHGSLRPENLFVVSGEDGGERLLVADYGLASLIPDERPTAWQPYAAPELAGAQPADRRSDIYALGAILHEALTGARPASATTAAAPPPMPPRTLRPTIPPPVEAIVLRCLARDPDARYRSAAALVADLDASAEELRAVTPGASPPPVARAEPSAIVVRADGPTDLALTPGEPQTIAIVIANGGTVATTLRLELDGAPQAWAALSATVVQLAPDTSERVTLTIDVARDPHNSAGEYPIVLRAVPPEEDAHPATLTMLWTVRPFSEGSLTVQHTGTVADVATYSVRLANEGNAPVRRRLAFAAPPPLSGHFAPETVDLDPHGEATATLTVTAPRRALGRARRLPFTVEARSASAPPLTARGELRQSPRIPLWLPLLGVLVLTLASGAALVAAFLPELTMGVSTPTPPAPTPVVAQEVPVEPTAEPTTTAAPPLAATTTARATATTPLALSATSVNFGAVAIGGTAVQNIQVRNTTTRALTFERIQIDGANAGDFSRAGPCGLTRLDSGLTCPITIIFSPTGGGNRVARLTLALADGTSQAIDLSGSGTARPSGTPSIAAPTRPVPPLAGARSGQAAALLADGRRLLVPGGRNGANILKSVEIYDLATNAWAGGRDLSEARAGHTATVLPDGKVVVIGGRGSSQLLGSAEEYDPATQGWSPFPALTAPREGHTTTLLVDSRTRGYRLLVLGGRGQGGVLDSAEIYDSNTRTWTETPRFLPGGRAGQTATLLRVAEGETPRLLLVGGATANGEPARAQIVEPLGSAEPRDLPGVPDELIARTEYTATLIEATGEVVFSGGTSGSENVATVTIYNPASAPESAWRTSGTTLLNGRAAHTATLLPYGRILLVAGRVGPRETTSTELLDPARLATP